ncbi:MAG: V-type ATP synthase subunit E [Candidatus Cloacimonetes bacterium]|nr:V-type ATP synthase subunit E [Candidatus Cloacimonadota bacterium]
MADQLQEMLKKIYDEGVNKAKVEAAKILETAQQEADRLKAQAIKEAEKILNDAKQKAVEIDKNIHSDLKMASQQSMSALKNKIVNAIMTDTIDKKINQSMQDFTFLQKLILEVLGKWSPDSSVVLTLPEDKKKDLESFFATQVKSVFNGKLQVEYSPIMKNGLSISPENNTYKLSFTDEDFANFFKSYLRPKAAQILFGE